MPEPTMPTLVFCSCALADESLYLKLEAHLSLLRRQGVITTWYRRDIVPGTDWATAIDTHLDTASVILLLISPDFFASDYCYGVELQRAMERHDANKVRVIPVLLRPVADWKEAPFARLSVLPTNARPVTKWRHRDEAWADVVAGIRRAIEELPGLTVSTPRTTLLSVGNIPSPRNPVLGEHPSLSATPIYHNLPHPDYSNFVGRQKEIDWLREKLALRDRADKLVLSGIGGMGKSALALFIAFYYYEHYNDLPAEERFEAIIWISAREEVLTLKGRKKAAPSGLVLRTLEDMYTTIAQALKRQDITRAIPDEQDRLVQHALGAQRTLLIVDNLESITDERVHSFLYHLPLSTKCIITSREWVDVPAVRKLTGLPFEEAEMMILEEATTRELKLNEVQRQQLFERTSGFPLPIKLTCSKMASGATFEQVMRWLSNAVGDLAEYCIKEQIDDACRHHIGTQSLLLACSYFDRDAGASREAVGFIANLSPIDRDEVLTLLQRLSLINPTEDDRFWLLPIVQEYVEAKLAGADFDGELTKQWLHWLSKCLERYGIDLFEHGIELEGRPERMQIISTEYTNVLRAIRWCRVHEQWSPLLQLVDGIWNYPNLVGRLGELREMLEAAVQAAQAIGSKQQEWELLRRLGKLLWEQGQHEKALVEYIEKAEAIALQYGDLERGKVIDVRIAILTSQEQYREAELLAKTLLETGERLHSVELKNVATFRLSRIAFQQQQYEQALEWLDQSEQWCKELGWSQRLAWIMHGRAEILAQLGETDIAEALLEQSLSIATVWNECGLIGYNKLVLARLAKSKGRFQLAVSAAEEAYDLFERVGWAKEAEQVKDLLQTLHGEDIEV